MSSACYKPDCSSSGRRMYIQLWIGTITYSSISSFVGRRVCLNTLFYLPTHLPTYLPTHLPTHPPTTHLPTYPPIYLPTTHLPTHPPTYLPTHYPPTYPLIYLPPTHLPTCVCVCVCVCVCTRVHACRYYCVIFLFIWCTFDASCYIAEDVAQQVHLWWHKSSATCLCRMHCINTAYSSVHLKMFVSLRKICTGTEMAKKIS